MWVNLLSPLQRQLFDSFGQEKVSGLWKVRCGFEAGSEVMRCVPMRLCGFPADAVVCVHLCDLAL